jgi:hypothetical protein
VRTFGMTAYERELFAVCLRLNQAHEPTAAVAVL